MTALDYILPHVPAFLLVMFRISGIFIFGPVFGSNIIPIRLKVMLALALSFCIYPVIPPQVPIALSLSTLALAVGAELLIGLVIGFGASLPLVALQLSGQMMGHQLGLGLAQVFNPDFNEETDVLGQFLFLTALTIFLLLNGHHAILTALVNSFHAVPLGGFVPQADLVTLILGLLTSMFELGLRVAAPLLCLVFLETVAMGFVARTVPQLNILALGFPLRIMIGFFLLICIVAAIFDSLSDSIRQAMSTILRFFSL